MEDKRMRSTRLSFVALALVLVSSPAAAGTRLGVIGGFNVANLSIEGTSGLNSRSSFAIGGVVDVGINDRFGIRVEPTFLSKGGKATKNTYWGSVDEVQFKLDCIDLPVLARIDLAKSETRGYLLGGVGVSFATQYKADLTQAGVRETVDFGDVFKSNDVSLDLGAGVGLPVGSNRMTFDGRVAIGLVDINDGGTVTYQGAPLAVPSRSTKTLDLRFFATYLFALPSK
jgi:outer membrane protein with beta-barrel domain